MESCNGIFEKVKWLQQSSSFIQDHMLEETGPEPRLHDRVDCIDKISFTSSASHNAGHNFELGTEAFSTSISASHISSASKLVTTAYINRDGCSSAQVLSSEISP